MKITRQVVSTTVGSLTSALLLAAGVHAQMGPMNGMSSKGSMGGGMMGGMMGGMTGGMMKDMMPIRSLLMSHDAITRTVQDIPGGVRTIETSENPQAMLLIRQHARTAVSEFVKYGMPRAMQPTPLPKGYRPIGGKAGTAAMGGGMMGM